MLAPPKPTSPLEFEQVLRQIQGIVDFEQQRKELLGTKGDTAQQWLDLFQLLAEYPNVSTTLRPSIFKLMIRLSRNSGLHPQCLTIQGVEKLGDYPVGGGAFGDVWQGRFAQQLVCLKVIRVFSRSDVQQILKNYMQEGIVWRQLSHPNVLPFMGIYYLDSKQRQMCLVSPWMERGNLVEFLKNADNSVDRMLLAYDVACGLAHLHAKEIVHGDLKGVNILVTPDLRACITDFGLSRISTTQLLLTETSRAKGTTRWLAPELLTPGPRILPTRQSDVYAYGCVCYEIFTGRFPFHEFAEATIVIAIYLNKHRPSRPEECPQLRDVMWYLMGDCWNETPSLRPTMTDVLVRIEEMNADRRLEPASNWNKPAFTQIWNDVDHPSVIYTGESNPPPSANPDYLYSSFSELLPLDCDDDFVQPIPMSSTSQSISYPAHTDLPATYGDDPFDSYQPPSFFASIEKQQRPLDPRQQQKLRPVVSPAIIKAARSRRERPPAFQCQMCGSTFTARHNLTSEPSRRSPLSFILLISDYSDHMNAHMGLKLHTCQKCGRSFVTKHVLTRHQRTCEEADG
ncbi:kinase-like protein [Marasmius fiardii PR-910]|nr:kinase-like protein [Marasmius fiardii PR-910]